MGKRFLVLLLCLALLVTTGSLGGVAVFAADTDKTLTVGTQKSDGALADFAGFQCLRFPNCGAISISNVSDAVVGDGPRNVTVEVEYYWTNPGRDGWIIMRSNGKDGAPVENDINTHKDFFAANKWMTWTVQLTDAYFGSRADGTDLYFSFGADPDDICYIRSIRVYETATPDNFAAYGPKNATGSTIQYPYQDVSLSFEERAADLVSRMTLEEKLSQFGSNNASINRLGVAHYDYWTEALHGVARLGEATSFPFSVGMASTWDDDLILEIATATADEARGYANGTGRGLNYFSPTINLSRDPRWGRSDETYGEDPFLTSIIGQRFVEGFQGDDERYEKVNSTIKHYAANNSEFNRHKGTSDMDNRTLLEYYTRAFKSITLNTRVASVMGAYNRVNDVPVSANNYLLDTLLRLRWGFDGFVVSDCGAVTNIYQDHMWKPSEEYLSQYEDSGRYIDATGRVTPQGAAALALLAGTDLNCGDAYNRYMATAVEEGLVSEGDLDIALVRIFTSRFRSGEFDPAEMVPYRSDAYSFENQVENAAHKQLAEDAADQAIVLLKNEMAKGDNTSILPLSKSEKNIVMIGEIADKVILGGYSGMPSEENCSTPVQGVESLLGAKVTQIGTTASQGGYVLNMRNVTLQKADGTAIRTLKPTESSVQKGCQLEGNANFGYVESGSYVLYENVDISELGKITVETSGAVQNTTQGSVDFHIGTPDGMLLASVSTEHTTGWGDYKSFSAEVGSVGGAKTVTLCAVFNSATAKVNFTAAEKETIADADAVLLCVGTSTGDSSEGRDRSGLDLPRSQTSLINTVAALNPRTVVYIQAVNMVNVEDFKDNVPAILWCAYNGQAQGNAMARVVFGDANPSAKLTFTWYANEYQLPEITDYSIRSGEDSYGRTYQYFTGDVTYPFGYGLSYTNFTYSNLKVDKTAVTPNDTIRVTVDVKNSGKVDGAEVVQLYVVPPVHDKVERPAKQLKGFDKVRLKAGETKTVTIDVAMEDLYFYDEETGKTVYDQGEYTLEVGASSEDIKFTKPFTLTGDIADTLQAVQTSPDKVVLNADKAGEGTMSANVTASLKNDTLLELDQATVSYASNNSGVATVGADGVVTAVSPGVCTITATVTYGGATMTSSFPVVVQGEVRFAEGTLSDGAVTVSGELPVGGKLRAAEVTDDSNFFYESFVSYFENLYGGASEMLVYDLSVIWNYDGVDIEKPVTIRIQLPDGFAGNRVFAMERREGELTEMQITEADGALTFTGNIGDFYAVAAFGKPGDIDGNGVVNTTDARLALQYAVEKITLDAAQVAAGDVNGDGVVNTTDARLILQKAVEKIDRFPVEERDS